jgi:hypothetical protein
VQRALSARKRHRRRSFQCYVVEGRGRCPVSARAAVTKSQSAIEKTARGPRTEIHQLCPDTAVGENATLAISVLMRFKSRAAYDSITDNFISSITPSAGGLARFTGGGRRGHSWSSHHNDHPLLCDAPDDAALQSQRPPARSRNSTGGPSDIIVGSPGQRPITSTAKNHGLRKPTGRGH